MRIGSLFSGAGGLDLAVQSVFGGHIVWHSEIDKAATKVLTHHWPEVPNLGDITAIDWDTVPPVDVLCGGFPCQDVSAAGKRAGIKDGTRSGLWAIFADAIDALRPPIVIIENVRGLLSAAAHRNVESADAVVGDGAGGPVLRAAGAVLGDLADLGYDAVWTTVAAADVGAPHRRERVFILATDTGYGDESERAWQAGRQAGERFSVRGITGRDGEGFAADTVCPAVGVDPGAAPGPEAGKNSGDGSGNHRGKRADVELLPTPAAGNFNDGEDAEQWLARQAAVKERLNNGNGMGMPLAIAVQLLPTPTVQDGANNAGPSQFQRNTLPLNAEFTLLPTPQAHDSQGPKTPEQIAIMRAKGAGVRNLNETAVHELLGTPQARDYKGAPGKDFNKGNLCRDVALLCTPAASDGAGGKTSRSGSRIDEPLLGGQAREMATAWGKYAPAIHRWESLTRSAPAPTEPNKNGNPRLSAAFSEWLMGWPAGWVTDPDIGISRNDQLRIVGNGVCPQQAIAAITWLLNITQAVS